MVWDYIFDTDFLQRADIESLEQSAQGTGEALQAYSARMTRLERRIDRQELAMEALAEILRLRFGVSRDELALMIQRLDLADGVEDGRIGPDRVARAPRCGRCGRPVNPRREMCIYCNQRVENREESEPAPPQRTTSCAACGAEIPEDESYFCERGVVCGTCFGG